MDEKINFISKNISKINNTTEILNYIETNKINYSKNSNGYFLNLSLIENKHIDFLYINIKNNLIILDLCKKDVIIPDVKYKEIKKIYERIKLTDLEKKILNYI